MNDMLGMAVWFDLLSKEARRTHEFEAQERLARRTLRRRLSAMLRKLGARLRH